MTPRQLRLLCFFSCTFCIILACSDDELYVIRNVASPGLVLDGRNSSDITVQYFNGFSPQLWRFKRGAHPGLFYIINSDTGHVLDFSENDPLSLVANKRNNGLRQQWSVTLNGRIVNSENQQNIDVWRSNFTAGNRLIVRPENGNLAQEFVLEKKTGEDKNVLCHVFVDYGLVHNEKV